MIVDTVELAERIASLYEGMERAPTLLETYAASLAKTVMDYRPESDEEETRC